MSTKTLVVVQCRFNSTRLPGKALYPVAGTPLVSFLLNRLKAGLPENRYHIVLATSQRPADDIICAWGKIDGIPVVRGDEDNVLRRFNQCLVRYPAETVVRVTADNPLSCPDILQQLVAAQIKKNAEYVDCENLPYGAGSDVYSSDLLRFLDKSLRAPDEREHINLHVLRNGHRFKIFHHRITGKLARPELRMTVDTEEDWLHVNEIFDSETVEPWRISLAQAIARMDQGSI